MANEWDAFPAVDQQQAPSPAAPASAGSEWDAFPVADQAPAEAPSLTARETFADVLRSAKSGLGRGVIGLAGLPGALADIGTQASDALFGTNAAATGAAISSAIGPAALQQRAENYVGKFYEPKSTLGQYAQTLGEFVPAIAGGPEGLIGRIATRAVLPAAVSETAGQLTQGTPAEPYARAAGALAGGFGPSIARRAATPFAIPAERASALSTLADEGVQVPASMAVGSKSLKVAESQLGGSQYGDAVSRMNDQFTAASLRRANIPNETRALPQVINATEDRVGNAFDTVAARNASIPIPGFSTVGNAIAGDFKNLTGQDSPLLNSLMGRIGSDISGRNYQAIQSEIQRYARDTSSPELRSALYDTKAALDKAVQSGLKDPADAAAWAQARRDWKNLMVIKKAVSGSTEAAAAGIITPAKLTQAIESVKRGSYARGQGDFSDLARSGNLVMKGYQDSGTASRVASYAVPAAVGSAFASGSPWPLLGIAAPYVGGRVLMSRPVQRYLANQRFAPATGTLRRNVGAIAAPSFVQGQR